MSVVTQQLVSQASLTPPPQPTLHPEASRPSSAPIPNKHLAFCPSGPVSGQTQQTPTPPASPPSKHTSLQSSPLIHPDEAHPKISESPAVYTIDACTLATVIEQLASQIFPDPGLVFPWLHGLHTDNQVQLGFFVARRKALRKTPRCFRTITIVKVGGDLSVARLKGAICAEEVLGDASEQGANFLEVDPRDGFSVRNFQIQATKMATVSDIIVYGDDTADHDQVRVLAERFATAQYNWRIRNCHDDDDTPVFNTFALSSQ